MLRMFKTVPNTTKTVRAPVPYSSEETTSQVSDMRQGFQEQPKRPDAHRGDAQGTTGGKMRDLQSQMQERFLVRDPQKEEP